MPTVKQIQDAYGIGKEYDDAMKPIRESLNLTSLLSGQFAMPATTIADTLAKSSFGLTSKFLESQTSTLSAIASAGAGLTTLADTYRSDALKMVTFASGIHTTAAELIQGLAPSLSVAGMIRDLLPDFSQLFEQYETARKLRSAKGEELLEGTGFSFVTKLVEAHEYGYYSHLPKRTQHAVATNLLGGFVRSAEFRQEIEHTFQGTDILRRRWGIVDEALSVARGQPSRYSLVVPAVFAQVEGIVTDLFLLKNLVERDAKGKVWVIDLQTGARKLNRNGDPIQASGMGQLLQNCKFDASSETILSDTAGFLSSSIVGPRNAILHGYDTDYGKAKLAFTSLLLLWTLARGVPQANF